MNNSGNIKYETAKAETVWYWKCPHCEINDFAEIPKNRKKGTFTFTVVCDYCQNIIEVVVDE